MSGIAAIGEASQVAGFALAGARVHPAEDAAAVVAAWHALPDEVEIVVLSPAAAAALDGRTTGGPRLTVVMPP